MCLAEGCLSKMQAWATKLLVGLAKMPDMGSITLKDLVVDGCIFADLKNLIVESKTFEEIAAGPACEGVASLVPCLRRLKRSCLIRWQCSLIVC